MKFGIILSSCLLFICFTSCQKKVAEVMKTSEVEPYELKEVNSYDAEIATWQNEEMETYLAAFNVFEEKVFTKNDFAFYPVSENHKVSAVVTLTPDTEIFEMKTSGTKTPRYREYGTIAFTLSGEEHSLTLYQNIEMMDHPEYGDYLFCPFYDMTNGDTTYGGGRYLDFKIPKGEEVMVDFNKCYNPYCAYLDKFNCPITPVKNSLTVAVEAGMQLLGDDH